jgi:hypothetical protein
MTPMKKRARSASARGRERRRYPRFSVSAGFGYRVRRLPPPTRMVSLLKTLRSGQTENVSAGGLSLTTSQLLLPGTLLEVDVPKSPATKAGRRRARVVWVREVSPGSYQAGIRFV